MGEEVKRGTSTPEEILSWRFPEGDLWFKGLLPPPIHPTTGNR
jgi:hypothetical protein